MALLLYTDHHVARAITLGLRLRGIDVLTAYEDGSHEISDPKLLDRATELKRVLFSQDEDLLVEATRRQRNGIAFGGVIYTHLLDIAIGQCIADLELIASAGSDTDMESQIMYLPL